MTEAAFDRVNESQLAGLLDLAPDVGTQLGLPQGDDRWPVVSEDGRAAVLRHLGAWATALEALPADTLTSDQVLDRRVFIAHLGLVRFAHDVLAQRRHDPDCLSGVSWTLLRQAQGLHVPPEQRFVNLSARLRGLGAHLAAARSVVIAPDPVWLGVAREVAAETPALVQAIVQSARAEAIPEVLKDDVAHAAEAALASVVEHQAWLRDLVPVDGSPRVVGAEKFEELCRLRGLGLGVAALRQFGERHVRECRAERRRWTHRVAPVGTPADGLAALVADPPATFAEGLERVRRASAEAREFCRARHLVLLPPGESLDVVETPAPLRPLVPFAALLPAPRFASEQRSLYLVTPRGDGSLRDFCGSDVDNTAAHEGYPGHHVQQTFANTSTGLLRDGVPLGLYAESSASWATETIEGWAHYCEEMMLEEGFRGGALAHLQIARDALWRAHRVVLDIGLATGTTGVEAAAQVLVEDLGMPADAARAEVNRYTRTPGYALCYLFGKHRLFELRRQAQLAWGAEFTVRRFHDLVLSSGNVPLTYVAQRLAPAA